MTARIRPSFITVPRGLPALCAAIALAGAAQAGMATVHGRVDAGRDNRHAPHPLNAAGARAAASFEAASQADLGATLVLLQGLYAGADWKTAGHEPSALDNVSIEAVPEPSTWLMLLAGLAAVVFARRRR